MTFKYRLYLLTAFVLVCHLAACVKAPTIAPVAQHAKTDAVLSGAAFAYDGDSIFFGRIEVRLDGIDAPERDQACLDRNGRFWPCGVASRDALRVLMGTGEVTCRLSGKDKYKRLLGICYAGRRDLNAAMVEKGYAIAYHYFSERYAPQEARARARALGIWQDAHFTEPYFCRHFESGHTCYEYDYAERTGRVAPLPLIGKSHAEGAPD